jgi:xylulose-5-phosphate/fructose-6-phosphate phosphoketolase
VPRLGDALATAFAAALDAPNLLAACLAGDGHAETGPTAGSRQGHKFLDPATCGAVLPTVYGCMTKRARRLLPRRGLAPQVECPVRRPRRIARRTLDVAHTSLGELSTGDSPPMILLRNPKG